MINNIRKVGRLFIFISARSIQKSKSVKIALGSCLYFGMYYTFPFFLLIKRLKAAVNSVSRGTTHESQADTPHLVGLWLNLKMKKLPPVVASRINNLLILDFLQKHIGTYTLYCMVNCYYSEV
jgi:hypothetical protein